MEEAVGKHSNEMFDHLFGYFWLAFRLIIMCALIGRLTLDMWHFIIDGL